MKKLNQKANKIMDKLTHGMIEIGNHKTLDSNKGFMPVIVECVGRVKGVSGSGLIFSVAHYYEQNGDLMSDPEMTFLQAEDLMDNKVAYYPMSYTQSGYGIYQESVILDEEGKLEGVRSKQQKDQAVFAGTWMTNINRQQDL